MPTILSKTTNGDILFLVTDVSPNIGAGVSAPLGSVCTTDNGSGIYTKTSSSNTGWTISTQRGNLSQLSASNYPSLPYDKGNVIVVDSSNKYMYVVMSVGTPPNAGGVSVYDISNPLSPVLITTLGCNSVSCFQPLSMVINGNYLYIGMATGHLWIVDVTNPLSPVTVGQILGGALNSKEYNLAYYTNGVDNYVLAAHQTTGLNIFKVTNPYSATLIYNQVASTATHAAGIGVNGNTCYVVYYTASAPYTIDNVTNWDITNPESPVIGVAQTIAGATKPISIVIDSTYNLAYLTETITNNVVYVLDITTPSSIALLSTITLSYPSSPNQTIEQPIVVDVSKRLIYVNNSGGVNRFGSIEVWNVASPVYPFKINSIGNFNTVSSPSITGMFLQNNTLFISSRNYRQILIYNTQ